MAGNYCIMALKKIHSMGVLQMSYDHNFREIPLKNVDISKSSENEELVNEGGFDYRELWYQRIKDVELQTGQPVAVRKNAVIAYEIVTSFSRDAQVDMECWKRANVRWMQDTFGVDNVVSMQLHEDETTPHIHTIVVPIDERGKLCAKSFTGGSGRMRAMQTSYGKAMEAVGLRRGEKYSRTKKEDLKRFYASVNKAAYAEAPVMEANEKIDDYVARVNAYVQELEMSSLWKEKEMQRKIDLAYTKHAQFKAKYSEAIGLQDDLEFSFGGNMRMVKERLRQYRKVEGAVPRKTLSGLLNSILQKFPPVENIRWMRDRKKKKKEGAFDIDGK